MNAKELLERTEKNILEETQSVVNMLYNDVQKKYESLSGAIDITVNLAYLYDWEESNQYNAKYNQIKTVFQNKFFQEMLEHKFGDMFQYLTFKKDENYFRLTIGHDPVKNIFVKLP